MNRHWFLLNDLFDDFLFFYDDRFVMMMDVFHLCVRVFVMSFLDRHMDHNLFLMIAAKTIKCHLYQSNIKLCRVQQF